MSLLILDGKLVSSKIKEELKQKLSTWKQVPNFAIIQVGNNFASNKYISNKIKIAQEIGMQAHCQKYPENINENELIFEVKKASEIFDALIVQLPLPNHINVQSVLDAVDYKKDADGLSSINYQNFYNNVDAVVPATPKGIMLLLKYYNIPLAGKHAYVIGESNLVGKPVKELLSRQNAITKSFNINTGIQGSENADILIVAAGSYHLVKSENVKKNSVIIDVGINTLGNNKIFGDVDFESIKNKVSAISPVPGGVGPMTVIALMVNIVEIFEKNNIQNK